MKNSKSIFTEIVKNYQGLKYALLDAQTFNPSHYGFPPIYYDIMESDHVRVNAFRKAFKKYNFKNKIVCEAGVGRLALSKHFLPQVKKAYLIENNPDLFKFIKKEIARNKWTKKVELIFGDALNVELPQKVDFIIGEMMSIYCANEFQVQVFRHLRKYLKPNGKLLPEKIINMAQLVSAEFEKGHRHYPIFLARHMPEKLSSSHKVNTIDLYKAKKDVVKKSISISPILSGTANAVYMRSYVQIAEGCNFTGTDSLMPPTVCRLKKEVKMKAGKRVKLKCEFRYGTSLEEAKFWVKR